MHILVAMGSFKGTIKSCWATDIVANVVEQKFPQASVRRLHLADGGEGTLEAFKEHFGGMIDGLLVRGPFGEQVEAKFLILPTGDWVI